MAKIQAALKACGITAPGGGGPGGGTQTTTTPNG